MAQTNMLNQVFNSIFVRPTAKQFPFIITIAAICFGSLVLFTVSAPFLKPVKPEMFPVAPASIPIPPEGYPAVLSFETANDKYYVGDTFDTDVIINTGGANAIGADVFFAYNPSILQVNNISKSNMFTSYPQIENIILSKNDGRISIGGYSLDEPFNGKGKFATIHFTAINDGVTNLSLYFMELGKTEDSNVSAFSETILGEGEERDILGSVEDSTIHIISSFPTPSPIPSPLPSPSPTASPSASPSITPLACHYNADLNIDGLYNSADLSILVSQWGQKNIPAGCHIDYQGNSLPNEDLNSDTTVNSIDIQIFVPWYNP